MLIDFDKISDESRIWIYPSSKKLSANEQDNILNNIINHIKTWSSHNNQVKASTTILYDYFIIVAVDEYLSKISGCSIDSMQNVIQLIENQFDLSLSNRLNIYFNVSDDVKIANISDLKNYITENDYFYDTLITKKSELDFFLKPIKDSWCARFI